MSKKKGSSKRVPHPKEEIVWGVVASHDALARRGSIIMGDGAVAVFKTSDFDRAGYSRVKIGAPIECSIAPSAEGKELVGIHHYKVRGERQAEALPT